MIDTILENLGPIIFVVIFIVSSFLKGAGNGDEDENPKPKRRREAPAEDPDALERQRRIQEEIRRKIMERRGQSEPREAPKEVVSEPMVAQEVQAEEQSASSEKDQPHEAKSKHKSTGRFSWDESEESYGSQMASQLKRIEATKREAEKLQARAAEANASSDRSNSKSRNRRSGSRLSGPVRSSLRDPAAARAAFIYGEVLGQPVSMRKVNTVPGLN